MSIEILFINSNRLGYTRQALAALLADPTEDFALSIWDNASTDGTKEFLEAATDPRIKRKVFARENVFLTGAANEIFGKSDADLLAIIPDDFLVPPGWTRPLAAVHAEVPQAGLISCWFHGQDLFDENRARHKIQNLGRSRILRHPWTGGGAALFKRKAWDEAGRFEGISTPDCWKRMAGNGYVNGFLLPPIYVEHMDDPWSPYYCGTVSSIRKIRGTVTNERAWEFHLAVVREILDGPWDVKYYVGRRGKLRSRINKVRRQLAKLGLGAAPRAYPAILPAQKALPNQVSSISCP
jgi:glycosyltransferase involved in cell wall biosynthesis